MAKSDAQSRRICIVSTAHPIDDVRVYSKFVRSFAAAGWEVTWVGPDLRLYDEHFNDDNVTYKTYAKGGRGRLLCALITAWTVLRLGRRFSWYYAPTPDAAQIALVAGCLTRTKVLFDVLEVYHGSQLDRHVQNPGLARIARHIMLRWLRLLCARADLSIYVNGSLQADYAKAGRPGVIVRSCAPAWFADEKPLTRDPSNFRVMHGKAGAISGTRVLIQALAMLPSDTSIKAVVFPYAAGSGHTLMPNYEELVTRLDVGHLLEEHTAVPHEQMPALMQSCDVGLIAYGSGLAEASLPNRLFEYMASGLAILAPDKSVEIKAVLIAEGAGTTFDSDDPASLARTLQQLVANRSAVDASGRRARQAFLTRHSWDVEFAKLIRLI